MINNKTFMVDLKQPHMMANIEFQQCKWVLTPTLVVGAPPARDEAVGDLQAGLMARIKRSAGRPDVVREVEWRAEQHQRHVTVRRDGVVVLVD